MHGSSSDHGNAHESIDRETPAPELPAEHALLALLELSGGTAHGYKLARQFRRGRPLGDIIRLEQAMLYKHLKKLARLGWVTMSVEEQPSRPPRQICQLTQAGAEELHRWLAEPVVRTREIRLEFLVKLYFARQLDPTLAWSLARQQHTVTEQLAQSLKGQLARRSGPEEDPEFDRMVLALRLKQTLAAEEWLTEVVEAFRPRAEQATPRPKASH